MSGSGKKQRSQGGVGHFLLKQSVIESKLSSFQTFQYITVNSSPGHNIWDMARQQLASLSILSRHLIVTLTNNISLQTRNGPRRVTLMLAGLERRPWCSAGHIRHLTRTGSSLCPRDSSSKGRGQAPAHQSKLRSEGSGPRMRGQ